jgi:hypothetical protein
VERIMNDGSWGRRSASLILCSRGYPITKITDSPQPESKGIFLFSRPGIGAIKRSVARL